MISAIEGQSGAGMLYAHVGSRCGQPDYVLQDFDTLFFRGFMFGRPVVGDQKFAQRYSHKTAVKLAEKFARMYGVHFLAVPAKCAAVGRAAAGVPEFHTPPSNTGVNEFQQVARGSL